MSRSDPVSAGDSQNVRLTFTPAVADSGSHIPALDAVRGVAILLVMLFHFSSYGHGLAPSAVLVDRLYYLVSRSGWIGVDLFFVLSGFLITGILRDAKGSPHYFRNFYIRRALRIFPLYYGALIVFLIILPRLVPGHPGVRLIEQDSGWYWTYLANVRIASAGWPEFGAIGHFWSLAIEEQFYLVWPIIVLVLGAARLRAACVALIIGALIIRVALNVNGEGVGAFVLMPARVDALAVGAYLAVVARGPGGLRRFARWAAPVAGMAGLSLLAMLVGRSGLAAYDPVVSTVGHTLIALLFGAILVLALTSTSESMTGRFLDSPVLRFFGRYSYGLYVFHHPILFFRPGALPLEMLPTIYGSQLLRQVVFIVIATGISVGLAVLSWHLYEKQFLKLKRLFPYREPTTTGGSPIILEREIAAGAQK